MGAYRLWICGEHGHPFAPFAATSWSKAVAQQESLKDAVYATVVVEAARELSDDDPAWTA